jgi:hydrogenase-4 membrane subunit HyfE
MLEQLAHWLDGTNLHQAFAAAEWFVPSVQTVHILGIAIVATTVCMLNLRLLRGPAAVPALAEMSSRFLPWTWSALLVLLVTGVALIVAEPGRELESTPIRVKMLLVVLLALLTLTTQLTVRRDANYWYGSVVRRYGAMAIAVASILLCAGIVAAGRLIAYVVHG